MMLVASIKRWHLDVAPSPDSAIVLSTAKAESLTLEQSR